MSAALQQCLLFAGVYPCSCPCPRGPAPLYLRHPEGCKTPLRSALALPSRMERQVVGNPRDRLLVGPRSVGSRYTAEAPSRSAPSARRPRACSAPRYSDAEVPAAVLAVPAQFENATLAGLLLTKSSGPKRHSCPFRNSA